MNKISIIFKRFGALALAATFATLVAGCGDSKAPQPSEDEKKIMEEQIAPVGKLRTQPEESK
uniref:Uncharacterized protein n=1 Tax=Candidatus Kentrum sp. TC TaxID=2126339 RepID=A0A450YIV4_9GAMM|nr:MAG: hypothetical protein BECKTC1821D_GA0114238_10109 [Candidatus Kentron sp. TC]VFK42600.1 MAG: hypothetical protein BECKTC1821E_GA0114239_10209 [Candidatus Kentron sp. TC]VFK62437.1 MAG: hypothetical protein BECKTC1821F_GA0114240_10749 [Candidatus Kentron sp. TC]